jgi:hypothetical protein
LPKIYYLLFCTLFFSAIACEAEAQNLLVLRKKVKTVKLFRVGNSIKLKSNKTDFWYSGTIEAIKEKEIVVTGNTFPLNEITKLKLMRTALNYEAGGVMLMAGGVLLPPMVLVNSALEGEFKPRIQPFVTSAALITGGFWLIKKRYKTIQLKKSSNFYLRIHLQDLSSN